MATALFACLFALASWLASDRGLSPAPRPPLTAARQHPLIPPVPEAQILKPIPPAQARAENSAVPVVADGLERAPAFVLPDSPALALGRASALDCLTAAIHYEAASEGETGQKAVAQVVLNRVRHPAFPASVCGVVYQGAERTTGCQFTFTCDGSLARRPPRASWERARRIALEALSGTVEPSVGMATHYHADWVVPYWADDLDKIAITGAHIFYRWRGSWGRRAAFTQRYAGEVVTAGELSAAPLQLADAAAIATVDPVTSLAGARSPLAADQQPAVILEDKPRALLADEHLAQLLADEQRVRLRVDDEALQRSGQ